MSRIVYTVGYAAMRPPELLALAKGLDVTVVDVRGRPTSRRPGFGGRQLAALLGDRYTWMGDRLGGVNHLANARKRWPAGLRAMLAKVKRPLMLCQCHSPGGCHRHQLAMEVLKISKRADVIHLFEDEAIEAEEVTRVLAAVAEGDEDDYEAVNFTSPVELLLIEREGFGWHLDDYEAPPWG